MAKQALRRQVRQSAIAVGIATLGLLALGLSVVLVNLLVTTARARNVPLGELPAIFGCCMVVTMLEEELASVMIRGTSRLWLLAGVVGVQMVLWAAALTVAMAMGIEEILAGGIPLSMLVYIISRPVAVFLKPGQRWSARLRRTVREIKMGVMRVIFIPIGLTVILYVYLTVFTQLAPGVEFLVMGFAMPLVQAVLMSLVAEITGRHEIKVKTKKQALSEASSSPDVAPPVLAATAPASKYASAQSVPEDPSISSCVSLTMVYGAEVLYSTSAFATLALAESDQTFMLSLISMLFIEIGQVALHVKARRAMSRVVDASTAEALLGDDALILQWLLHQELGEKIGLLVALGFLAMDKALGRTVPAVQAVGWARLAHRAAAMIVLELLGDLGKDVVSQAFGVLSSGESVPSAAVTRLGIIFGVLECLLAGFAVQSGLALGT